MWLNSYLGLDNDIVNLVTKLELVCTFVDATLSHSHMQAYHMLVLAGTCVYGI